MGSQLNQSVSKAFRMLEALASIDGPIGSREFSRILHEEHTGVSRMLKTLEGMGYLSQNQDRRYQAGPALHILGARCLKSSPILQCSLPLLKELHTDGYRCALGVLHGDQVCYLYHGGPPAKFEEGLSGHEVLPAYQSSIGRLLRRLHGKTLGSDMSTQSESHFSKGEMGSVAVPILIDETLQAGLAIVGSKSHKTEYLSRLKKIMETYFPQEN